jgi:ferredoxin
MSEELHMDNLTRVFGEKVSEVEEDEFQFPKERVRYATSSIGKPEVKLAIGNIPLFYDLWEGLRNPAVVGMHPLSLREIWEFYANKTKKTVDEYGRQTIFKIPRQFDSIQKDFKRVIVISVMLPFSDKLINDYAKIILVKERGSSYLFTRMYEDINRIIDKATSRVAIDLVTDKNVVLAMDNDTVKSVSNDAVPAMHQGDAHGPAKGGNYPQKSVAALLGLGQFGVGRFIFRDELVDGMVQRFVGPIRSIIVFDKEDVVKDHSGGLILPTDQWRDFLFKLYNFTNVDPEVNKYRFCTYIPSNDEGCGECVRRCPSGAQINSVPSPNGKYSENVSRQRHRFWEDRLEFDFSRCCEQRGQMTTLFPEWSCARCLSTCAAFGRKRTYAADNFYTKMLELTSAE